MDFTFLFTGLTGMRPYRICQGPLPLATIRACVSNKIYSFCGVYLPTAAKAHFYYHGLTLIPAWISNYMPGKVWDGIIHPILNFNGCTVEV